jgi:hypothetical protein
MNWDNVVGDGTAGSGATAAASSSGSRGTGAAAVAAAALLTVRYGVIVFRKSDRSRMADSSHNF